MFMQVRTDSLIFDSRAVASVSSDQARRPPLILFRSFSWSNDIALEVLLNIRSWWTAYCNLDWMILDVHGADFDWDILRLSHLESAREGSSRRTARAQASACGHRPQKPHDAGTLTMPLTLHLWTTPSPDWSGCHSDHPKHPSIVARVMATEVIELIFESLTSMGCVFEIELHEMRLKHFRDHWSWRWNSSESIVCNKGGGCK